MSLLAELSTFLSQPVTLALISAATGTVGAIIAWIQAVRTVRLKSNVDLAIERLKSDQDRIKRAFDVATEECKPIEVALGETWQNIQMMKETIARVTSTARFDSDLALKEARQATHNLTTQYAVHGVAVPPEARAAWHSAKGAMGIAMTTLEEFLTSKLSDVSASTFKRRLRRVSRELSEQQVLIADCRQAMRETFMKRIVDAIR